MGDRAMAIGFLAAVPISMAIAVPGAVIVYILLMRYLRKQDSE